MCSSADGMPWLAYVRRRGNERMCVRARASVCVWVRAREVLKAYDKLS